MPERSRDESEQVAEWSHGKRRSDPADGGKTSHTLNGGPASLT